MSHKNYFNTGSPENLWHLCAPVRLDVFTFEFDRAYDVSMVITVLQIQNATAAIVTLRSSRIYYAVGHARTIAFNSNNSSAELT